MPEWNGSTQSAKDSRPCRCNAEIDFSPEGSMSSKSSWLLENKVVNSREQTVFLSESPSTSEKLSVTISTNSAS